MAHKTKILLAEDDPNLGSLLSEYLLAKGFEVTHARDGIEGYDAYKASTFDFIILDVMMPRMDGFALAEKIRAKDQKVPLLFLTAKTMEEDKLKGFKVGADDYLTKPFSMEELLARIGVILKRAGKEVDRAYEQSHPLGVYSFDPLKQTLEREEEQIRLTTKESQLLQLLSAHRNETLERQEALNKVWGDDSYHNGRSMDVYITKLRKHLKGDPSIEIVNVHGQGFRLLVG